MLVRRSNTAISDHWDDILCIIQANVEDTKEYELRMDMLALTEYILMQESLHSTIYFYSPIILKMILIPCTSWKVGKPNEKIRKAAIICMLKLLENHLIEDKKLYGLFQDVARVVKNCIDDDWANDLRYATVIFVKKLLEYLKEFMTDEDYKEIYPELLKRLDDS
mmetsp:Transcript_13554/g.9755  ORF Transcript_13554/g.9755 Transcript_13554/m.9755 type:complete len:165 (-) Transcript_13554:234-728(-)